MKSFQYGDEKISKNQLMLAIPSVILGVDILQLPKDLAVDMDGADGWIVLIVGGAISLFLVWIMTRLALRFPKQTFFTYATSIVSKKVAIVLTFLFAVLFIGLAAFDIRVLGHTSQQYLFDNTPVEVVSLSFLFVVVYAISGSRAALFRLNMMFFPIIITVLLFVLLVNVKWVELSNLMPAFQTDVKGFGGGLKTSVLVYGGYSIVLFYLALVDQPKKASKHMMFGMVTPIVLYLLVYLFSLMIFGRTATSHLLYPTIDLAKRIEIPGGILERVEALFFIVWTMGVFAATIIAFDVAILALNSIFKRMKKIHFVLILSPIVYYLALFPKDISEVNMFGEIIRSAMVAFSSITVVALFLIAKLRKVGGNDNASK